MSIRNGILKTDSTAPVLLLKERLDNYITTYIEPNEALSRLVEDSTFRKTLYKLYYDILHNILRHTGYEVHIDFRLEQDTEDKTPVFVVDAKIYRKYFEISTACESSLEDTPLGRTIEYFLSEKNIEYDKKLLEYSDEQILQELAKQLNVDYDKLYEEYNVFLEKLYYKCLEEMYEEINRESAIQLNMKIDTQKYKVEAYPLLCHSDYCEVGLDAVIELKVESILDFINELIELRKVIYTIGLLSTI